MLAASLLGSSIASAAPATRLVFARAPGAEGCPDEAAFRSEVSQRLGYDPFFPWASRTVSVEIDVASERARARIVVVDEHGLELGTQTLDGNRGALESTCADLVRAAALAVSVAFDSAPKPAAPTVETTDAPPTLEAENVVNAVEAPVVQSVTRAEKPTPSNSTRRATSLTIAPQLWAGYGQWPLATLGVGGAVGVRRGRFEIAVEGRWDVPSTLDVPSYGDVRLERATGSLVPCVDVSVVSFCAIASFGATWANGVTVADPQFASAFYAAFGARAALSFPLRRGLALGVVAEAEAVATPMHVVVGSARFDSGPLAASIGTNLTMSIF